MFYSDVSPPKSKFCWNFIEKGELFLVFGFGRGLFLGFRRCVAVVQFENSCPGTSFVEAAL